jgi:hypothetical protein
MNIRAVWCRTLFVPAGPHLSIGCLQTRAWEGEVSGHRGTARWLAQVGGYYRQETGMGRGRAEVVCHAFYLSYIYLGYFVCVCVCVCVCVTICCRTICYSFSFINQTDQGDETEGLEREG